jgi:ribose-phosphate pyrophosphokinase
MEIVTKKRMQVFTGTGTRSSPSEVADHLGMRLGDIDIHRVRQRRDLLPLRENVRGSDVFLIQTHCEPVNANIMEQLIMIDAAKRASAKRITAVVPFYGYARQDKKSKSREPITARLLADMLTTAGADRSCQRRPAHRADPGFFNKPLDHLTALPLLVGWIIDHSATRTSSSPHPTPAACGWRRSSPPRLPDAPIAFLAKTRTAHNVAKTLAVVGDVEGKTVVLVDDMIDTAAPCAARRRC